MIPLELKKNHLCSAQINIHSRISLLRNPYDELIVPFIIAVNCEIRQLWHPNLPRSMHVHTLPVNCSARLDVSCVRFLWPTMCFTVLYLQIYIERNPSFTVEITLGHCGVRPVVKTVRSLHPGAMSHWQNNNRASHFCLCRCTDVRAILWNMKSSGKDPGRDIDMTPHHNRHLCCLYS